MWIDFFEKNEFLKSIYDEEPNLEKIRIFQFFFDKYGNDLIIRFNLKRPNKTPKEWENEIFNTVQIKILFSEIEESFFYLDNKKKFSKIKFQIENKKIIMIVNGVFNINVKCKSASILDVLCYECELIEANYVD